MSDSKTDTQPPLDRGDKARSGRLIILMLTLLFVAGVGALVFWSNRSQLSEPHMATVAATAQPEALASRVAASDDTMQSLSALKQSVKELEASGQEIVNQLDELKRKLATEQGKKMLVEQVGALSGRVDGLSAAACCAPTGSIGTATAQSPQKKQSNSR
jgi:hypothetical protein